jgi:hypothetical protein
MMMETDFNLEGQLDWINEFNSHPNPPFFNSKTFQASVVRQTETFFHSRNIEQIQVQEDDSHD